MRVLRRWADVAGIPILLWLAALLTYGWLVHAGNAPRLLTGEEATSSFENVLGTSERFQFSYFSTNFAGHVFFWIASHLDPGFDLFYGRRWKAAAMALVAPLIYLLLRRRGGVGRPGAVIGAATAVLLPGVSSFAWLALEIGLEAVWGLIALLVVTSSRRVWPLGLLLASVSVSTYGAGLAWAAGVGAAAVWRIVRSRHRFRDACIALAGALASVGVIYFPKFWWTNTTTYIVTGGGTRDYDHIQSKILGLTTELISGKDFSYYFFDHRPALAGSALAVAALCGLVVALVQPRSRGLWPLWVIGLACLGLYSIAGGVLGVRRAIAIALVCACGVGVLADAIIAWALIHVRFVRPSRVHAAVSATLGLIVILPLGLSLRQWSLNLQAGSPQLPIDFAFPLASGETMEMALGRLSNELRDGSQTTPQLISTYEGERTLAMILLLADRNSQSTAGLPTTESITQLLYESPRCYEECRPVPGRP